MGIRVLVIGTTAEVTDGAGGVSDSSFQSLISRIPQISLSSSGGVLPSPPLLDDAELSSLPTIRGRYKDE